MTITLQRVLVGTIAIALIAGLLPAAIALDRRLAAVLEERARADLSHAPRMLADLTAANADALMMHAKDLAHLPELAEAMAAGDRARARRILTGATALPANAAPVLVADDGESWVGPVATSAMVAETRAGRMPVAINSTGHDLYTLALAPVERGGRWIGAAGLVVPIDEPFAASLGGLTRSGVVVLGPRILVSTLDSVATGAIADAARGWQDRQAVHQVASGGHQFLATGASLGDSVLVVFTRDLATELAVVPELRRLTVASIATGIAIALLLSALLAVRVSRPVRELAFAAEQLARGSFDAPLPKSRIAEVSRVSATFGQMRDALALRLEELRRANTQLSDRNARLSALQSDLMRRERLDATGRLVAQLAHEIRNPVANVRNCLELIRRRVDNDSEAREFAAMATQELLRMHRLSEQLLDLNRPRESAVQISDAVSIAREVATLTSVGIAPEQIPLRVVAPESLEVSMAPDALKQVLLNLVQNAREALSTVASPAAGEIEIAVRLLGSTAVVEVMDTGPGISEGLRERIFDPFFTTKGRVDGVGLGLFVAEGLVRTAGGRITASNRSNGQGACFRIEIPVAPLPSRASGGTVSGKGR